MEGLITEIKSENNSSLQVVKSLELKALERLCSQMSAQTLLLERIVELLQSSKDDHFEGKVAQSSRSHALVVTDEDGDLVSADADDGARSGQSRGNMASLMVQRVTGAGVAYKTRDDLFCTFIMSIYHTLLESQPEFEDLTQRPDYIQLHSWSTQIVASVSKALGDGKPLIPEMKETSMRELSGMLERTEKGEVFNVRPELLVKVRDGARTRGMFGVCQDILTGLAVIPELFPYPLACVVGSTKEPLLIKRDGAWIFNVDKSLLEKSIEKYSKLGRRSYKAIAHEKLPLYARMRITMGMSSRKTTRLINEASPDELEEALSKHGASSKPSRKRSPEMSPFIAFH